MFSPKRLSASLDDMRRKVIAKRISRDLHRNPQQLSPLSIPNSEGIPNAAMAITKLEPLTQLSQTRQPYKEEYILIPEQDMSFATEKQCKELDIYNDALYKKSYKLYQEIMAKLAGSSLELKQVPQPPPNPNNLHRLFHYRQRNQETNCLRQTAATCYLLGLGYRLVAHNPISGPQTTMNSEGHKLFEPYQAIELAREIAMARNENYLDLAQVLFEKIGIKECEPSTPSAPPPPPAFNQEYQPIYPQIFHQTYTQATEDSINALEPDMMQTTSLAEKKLPFYPIPDRRATAPAKLIP
jgi:hypothetical protein